MYIFVKTKKGEEVIECDVVLSAVGIEANIENIGLEDVGIVTDRGRILVNDYYQTNIPGYYAIGDVLPNAALAHVASAEGIICVEKIAGHNPEPLDYNNIPGCTYCSPEVASVGMTEAAAKEAGNVISFGQASDMAAYKPFPRVSSIIDDWAPYYIARTQAVLDGTWESTDTWDGIGPGMVSIGEITDAVPADVKAEALAMRDAIANGTYHPFTGPIKKQDGSEWLAAGETADDGTLLGMKFYVEGITGKVPE